jgi:hypothetical protein
MNVKFDALPATERSIVYIRAVQVADLPADVQAKVGDLSTVYSVNRPDGERLALVADRTRAFVLARQHKMDPVNVH